MIEVEKKFQPTDEQLEKMLEGAEFLGESVNHDIYYDYSDYRLFKSEVFLRERNGVFELKIKRASGVSKEIEEELEIKNFLGITDELREFLKANMIIVMEFSNNRKSYLKEGFHIDLDNMSFGDKGCEIELLLNDSDDTEKEGQRIIDFATKYGIEETKNYRKRISYLKRFKPEIYKKIYGTHS
jgi:adenylate cyclase class IV